MEEKDKNKNKANDKELIRVVTEEKKAGMWLLLHEGGLSVYKPNNRPSGITHNMSPKTLYKDQAAIYILERYQSDPKTIHRIIIGFLFLFEKGDQVNSFSTVVLKASKQNKE